jgi:hypothetical protein
MKALLPPPTGNGQSPPGGDLIAEVKRLRAEHHELSLAAAVSVARGETPLVAALKGIIAPPIVEVKAEHGLSLAAAVFKGIIPPPIPSPTHANGGASVNGGHLDHQTPRGVRQVQLCARRARVLARQRQRLSCRTLGSDARIRSRVQRIVKDHALVRRLDLLIDHLDLPIDPSAARGGNGAAGTSM